MADRDDQVSGRLWNCTAVAIHNAAVRAGLSAETLVKYNMTRPHAYYSLLVAAREVTDLWLEEILVQK